MDNKLNLFEEMIIPDRVEDWGESSESKSQDSLKGKIVSFEYETERMRDKDSIPASDFHPLFEKI
jgi:hypothetical protein